MRYVPAMNRHVPAVLLYAAVALITTHDSLFARDVLVGDAKFHAFEGAWFYAAVQTALFDGGVTSDLLRTPQPVDLLGLVPDIGNATLMSPVTALLGAEHAYDLMLTICVFLAGLATYSLSLQVQPRRAPALAAGVLFACASPLWFTLEWGEDDVAAMWLIPFVLAVLFWAVRRGTPRGAVAAALAIALVGYVNSYFLYFLACSTLVVAALQWRRFRDEPRRWAAFSAAYAVTALVAYGPRLAMGIRPSRKGTTEATSRVIFGVEDLLRKSPLYDETSSLDLHRFLFWPPGEPALIAEGHLYMGIAALLLAAVGVFFVRHRELLVVGVLGFVLAAGAYFLWDFETPGIGPLQVIPLPGGLATALVPGMERMNHLFRWVILTFVAVAVFAGVGIDRLVSRVPAPRWVQVLGIAAVTWGVVLERIWATPELAYVAQAQVDFGGWATSLPETERDGVLHLPIPLAVDGVPDTNKARYHLTVQLMGHGRPIYVLEELPLATRPMDRADVEAHLAQLVEDGVGVIVLDEQAMSRSAQVGAQLSAEWAGQTGQARTNLMACGLEQRVLDEGDVAWLVEPRCPEG